MRHSGDIRVTYVNQAPSMVQVSLDDGTTFSLKPGDSRTIGDSKRLLPERVEARDASGTLVFQTVLTQDYLESTSYRVTIVEEARR